MLLTLRRVWSTLSGQRARYAAAVAALVLASCCLYLAPLIPQAVIDGVLVPGQTAQPSRATRFVVDALGGASYLAGHLTWPASLFLVISALAGVFTYLRARWAAEASQAIVRGLRDRLYDHLQHLPCRYFDHAETGDLIQRCSSDVETLRKFLASQVVEIGRALIMLGVPIPLMLAIDARMTGLSLLLLPVISAFSFVTFRRIKTAFTATDEAEGALTARITENLNGIRVVRAFARQDHEQALFEARNRQHRDLDYALYGILARFWALSDLMCFVQKGIVVGAGAWWIAQGSLAVGAFFYFLTAVNLFLWPVRQMGRILADLGKAVVALERIDEILHEPTEADPADSPAADRLTGDVVFEGVSFAHGEHAVLREIDFALPAGRTLAILGASGSGKTTLVNLLLRLYDYEQGSIRLGGRELRELPRKQVRAHVAVVMQQPFLFSKDLAANVRLGRGEASHAEVVEATTSACVHRTIEGFDQGYGTVVGERGVTLSGGQAIQGDCR